MEVDRNTSIYLHGSTCTSINFHGRKFSSINVDESKSTFNVLPWKLVEGRMQVRLFPFTSVEASMETGEICAKALMEIGGNFHGKEASSMEVAGSFHEMRWKLP